MIRVLMSIEMDAHGYGLVTQSIGGMEIINAMDHPDRPAMGNYKVRILDADQISIFETRVENHPRDAGFWPIIHDVLDQVFEARQLDPTLDARFKPQ